MADAVLTTLHAAKQLRQLIRERREVIEDTRQLPADLFDRLGRLGVFRALMPAAGGGAEWAFPDWLQVVEELSVVDASVGWNCGIGAAASGFCTGWLPTSTVRQITSATANGVAAGSGNPGGRAVTADGGYTVSGRWAFASGAAHAGWLIGGVVIDGGAPHFGRMAIAPRQSWQIIDTWHTGGLRGTGSQDIAAEDLFVPAEHVVDLFAASVHHGPLYQLPPLYLLGSGVAPLCLGIARGAIDAFTATMRGKFDAITGGMMFERHTVQERLANAEALVRSARSYLYETAEHAWSIVMSGDTLNERQGADAHLAVIHTVQACVQAVDIVYHAAGTSAIFAAHPLERYFRDIHVARAHIGGSPEGIFRIGAVLFEQDGS